jgi:hypothetical protein
MKFIEVLKSEIGAIRQPNADLRKFGIVFFFVGVTLASLVYYKHGFQLEKILIYTGTAVVFLVLGFCAPTALRGFHKVWMILALVMGYIMTRVILLSTYTLLVVPIGILLRIFKKDILDLKINKEVDTFWKSSEKTDKKRLTKMY